MQIFVARPIIRSSLWFFVRVSILLTLVVLTFNSWVGTGSKVALAARLPRFDHIVIVVEENHSYSQIIGNSGAPYINSLVKQGALFTNSYAITHPSQPNYLALFAGSTFGVNDTCPQNLSEPDFGGQLISSSLTFVGYSESMPSAGYTGCAYPSSSPLYVRKHNPWADFPDTAGSKTNQPFSSFPTTFSNLPVVSFVVPNLQDDMHNGTVSAADTWLKSKLDSYVQWAKAHNSLFILTWDEDNDLSGNHIATLFVGAHVNVGYQSSTYTNHYRLLRTIEAIYGLAALRNAANYRPIRDVWN